MRFIIKLLETKKYLMRAKQTNNSRKTFTFTMDQYLDCILVRWYIPPYFINAFGSLSAELNNFNLEDMLFHGYGVVSQLLNANFNDNELF